MLGRPVQSSALKCNSLLPKQHLQSTQQRQFSKILSQFRLRPNTSLSSLSHNNNNSKLWNYLTQRKYSPGSSFEELSQSAWKENRFYRYYKFSDKVDEVRTIQRGYAAGIITLGLYFLGGWMLFCTAWPTSNHYVHVRRLVKSARLEYEGMTKQEMKARHLHGLYKFEYARHKESDATQNMTRQEYMNENTSFRCSKEERPFFNRSLVHVSIIPGLQPDQLYLAEPPQFRDAQWQAYERYIKDHPEYRPYDLPS